jgi:hypothetical protein
MIPGLPVTCEGVEIDCNEKGPMVSDILERTPISPNTKGLHTWRMSFLNKALMIISGPIPVGSPMVMAISGLSCITKKT